MSSTVKMRSALEDSGESAQTGDSNESKNVNKYGTFIENNEPVPPDETNPEPEVVIKRKVPLCGLFRYATGLDGLMMFLGTLGAMGHGAGIPIMMLIFGQMTDVFIDAGDTTSNATVVNSTVNPMDLFTDQMTMYSLRMAYVGCGVFFASYIQITFWVTSCERQTHSMRKAFFKNIMIQEIGWFDKHPSGELTTRLADDLERVREGIGDKFSLGIQFITLFVSAYIIAFIKGWKMALVLTAAAPLLVVISILMATVMSKLSKREQETYASAGAIAEEVLSCIRTVVAFGGEQRERRRYSDRLVEAQKLGIKKSITVGASMCLVFVVMFCSYALGFWYGPTLVSNGEMTGGNVLTVFFCIIMGSFSLGTASPHFSTIATAMGSASSVFDIIDREPEINSTENSGTRPSHMKGNINLSGVDFFYPSRPDVQVLHGLSISVKSGQTVALCGSSGCGKSTVVNLLLRFYDAMAGEITIDGYDIRSMDLKWLREQIGIVSQEPILFSCSIGENIAFGHTDVTMNQIMAAAKLANAHNFITDLPEGYDTLVGERGAQLSGGQKQRVAIARAMVRDPKILLLDEATSALDSESEGVVQSALDKAREGRTTIVIAHRLSTIQNADVIYTMDQGRAVESGNHQELMQLTGAYYELVKLQAIHGTSECEPDTPGHTGRETPLRSRTPSHRARPTSPLTTQTSRTRTVSTSNVIQDEKTAVVKLEENVVIPSYFTIFKLNAKEFPLMLFGFFWCLIAGGVFPFFAIAFSEVFKLFTKSPEEMREGAIFWSLMFIALGVAAGVSNFATISIFGATGEILTRRLRMMGFKGMLKQDVAWFDDPKHSTGALTTRLATEASLVKGATGIRIGTILNCIVTLSAGVTIAMIYGWKLGLVILACLPILALVGAVQMAVATNKDRTDKQADEAAGKTASEAIENIRTIQAFGLEDRFYSRYSTDLQVPYQNALRKAHIYAVAYGFSEGFMFFLYAGSFRLGAFYVAQGEMTAGNVFKVFFAISISGIGIGQASSFLPDFGKAKTAAANLLSVVHREPAIDSTSEKGNKLNHVEGEVVYRNIHFQYPSRPDVKVLKGLNLQVNPGQTVAIVGASGCGKSTLVSLLERFYDPIEGSVCIDGYDLRVLNTTWARNQMALVSQEPILFDCSIADNIKYGALSEVEMTDIERAAQNANIHNFISGLPLGYDTMVGEKGTQLSGGQKQRIAIARALIRNPKILLLDEATSALDSESEKIVQEALDKAQEGRTCIVIAHRLATVQNADSIAVIQDGQVVEQGTHEQLLMKRGVYSTLTSGQRNLTSKKTINDDSDHEEGTHF